MTIFANLGCQSRGSRPGETSVVESNRIQPPEWISGPAFKIMPSSLQCRQKKSHVMNIQLGLQQMATYGSFTCDRLIQQILSKCHPTSHFPVRWHEKAPQTKDIYFEKTNSFTSGAYGISILLEYDFAPHFLSSPDFSKLATCLSEVEHGL